MIRFAIEAYVIKMNSCGFAQAQMFYVDAEDADTAKSTVRSYLANRGLVGTLKVLNN